MQKINIKKHTKEQMVKMLETAYEANESATAELERTAAQIHAQQEEIAALREKLKETKSAYDAAMDDEERRVRKLEEQGSELARANEELEKAAERGGDEREAQGRAAVRGAAHDQDREKHQGGLPQEPQVVHGAPVAQPVALRERAFPILTP